MNSKESVQYLAERIKRYLLLSSLPLFPLAFLFCWYSPVINTTIRQATIVFALLTLCRLLYSVRKTRWLLWTIIAILTVFTVWLVSPSKPPHNRTQLRTAYTDAMLSYRDCPYMWGGEGRFGIDCSGLMRRGLEDALIQQGLLHLNPSLVREGISLWWNDTTAREMGRGYGGRTRVIATCRMLNDFDHSQLQPGDMAVTTSGIHVMAYLGNHQWIAADPGPDKVVTFTIPEKENAYFSTPMTLVRWQILEDSKISPATPSNTARD